MGIHNYDYCWIWGCGPNNRLNFFNRGLSEIETLLLLYLFLNIRNNSVLCCTFIGDIPSNTFLKICVGLTKIHNRYNLLLDVMQYVGGYLDLGISLAIRICLLNNILSNTSLPFLLHLGDKRAPKMLQDKVRGRSCRCFVDLCFF